MKRAVLAASLVLVTAACGGGGATPGPTPNPDIPTWYTSIPTDPNMLYQAATSESRDLQLAVNKATADGRNGIAQQMETKFQGLSERFQEETGLGAESELLDQFRTAYRGVVNQTLNGSRVSRQEIKQNGVTYRAFVLVEMPIGAANQALMQRIRSNQAMYTRFRAAQAFEELDRQVKAYEESQRSGNP
ncbi:hypothetical protein Strain138_000747 [Pseudogemmatithrix spongiicola]|uniref:LPP20 lipoprotein n=1 Tax=Pseudogemmatithrix spongiicola TaxID=3062599 RepID=A0AA49JZF8_9BACT|nr:hypothetical protein Strain138_000747 [Gemmatimonadaceae bacterium 'strain 138']WKW14403.1 hypothetical protein Strain318_000747 [Gemmatimonadaceae bacterium 'strain 318']